MADLRLAIDLRPDGARLAVIGDEGVHDLRRSARIDAVALAAAVAVLQARAPAAISRIGMALAPGAVPSWTDAEALAQELGRSTGLPVRAANLGACLAAGEALVRTGDFVLLALGGPLVAGAVVEGKVWRPGSGGLDLGHVVVDPTGARCGCGRRGCLAAIVEDGGLFRLATFHSLPLVPLSANPEGKPGIGPDRNAFAANLAARAQDGEVRVAALFDDVGRAVGLALSAAAQVLGVRQALLSGDAGTVAALLPRVAACVRRHGGTDLQVQATAPLGETVLLGAAAIA